MPDANSPMPDGSGSTPDTDHDGIPNSSDVCPDIADPAQADLDGDHVGWVCDPLESVTVQGAGTNPGITAALHGNTFMATVGTYMTDHWDLAVVGASPAAKLIIPGDSADPAHAWTHAAQVSAPLIDRDGNVWLSQGGASTGDTGLIDLASGAYTKKQDGVLGGDDFVEYSANEPALVALLDNWNGIASKIFSPQNSGLLLLDMAPGGIRDQSSPSGGYLAQTDSPTKFLYPVATTSSGPYALRSEVPFASTSSDVMIGATPATNLVELKRYPRKDPSTGAEIADVPYCIRQGSTYSYLGISSMGTTTAALPFTACPIETTIIGNTLVMPGTETAGTIGVVTVRAGVAYHSLSGLPAPSTVVVSGEQILVADVVPPTPGTPHSYWAIDPATGQSAALTSTLTNVTISAAGDAVAVTGMTPDVGGFGNIVTVRYRPATGVQQITIAQNISSTTQPIATVTPAGAVIVGANVVGGGKTWMVPSGSTTVTENTQMRLDGSLVRGNGMVLWATVGVTAQTAVFAYDELSGAPRLTTLLAAGPSRIVKALGPQWFAILGQNGTLYISRLLLDENQKPTIESQISTANASQINFWGTTTTGNYVASTESDLYLLTPNTAAKVATGSTFQMFSDEHVLSRPIVGWGGTDATGRFMCLASHPERCWSIPASNGAIFADSLATPDGSLGAAVFDSATSTLHIVRTIGFGTRPQPL